MKNWVVAVLMAFIVCLPVTVRTEVDVERTRQLAEQGDAKAQYNLGIMNHNGEGVRQNKATAKEWYGKACDNGYQDGCDAYRQLNEAGY